jgi:hypothetical protein
MKATRLIEAALEESIVGLFTDRPELCGFTVLEEGGLVLSEVGVFPAAAPEELRILCEEIRATLAEVVDESPEARVLLAGRTFARTLH